MIEELEESRLIAIDTQELLQQAREALAEGRTDDAFSIYRSLLAGETPQPENEAGQLDALLGLGVCHARRGEWAEAMIPLRELCDRAPTFAPARAYLGAARFELGEIDSACEDLDSAVDCAPDNSIARLKRAEVRLSLGLLDGAEEDLRVAARAAAPDDLTRQYAREMLKMTLKRKQRAAPRVTASPGDAIRGIVRFARDIARHD